MSLRAGADRRAVLAGFAAGGLVVGFRLDGRRAMAAEPAGFAPNAFVRIDAAGQVTAVLPKTEMGQGVFTAIPLMLAEELEVDPATIKVELPVGQAGRLGGVSQSTGGSTSVKDTWKPIRVAGATARVMLVAAAAERWGVEPAACRAELGQVIHARSGRRLAYGELVEAAGRLAPPPAPVLKTPDQYRVIGRGHRRLDAAAKIDGSARYGIDFDLPGLRVAALAICPEIGGQLDGVDEVAARATPGVRQLVRLPDAVAVVADHTWAAKQGLTAAAPQWRPGPHATLDQAAIVARLQEAARGPGAEALRSGDVEAGFRAAARRVDATYEQPFLAHAAMEPLSCTVRLAAHRCDVWLGTQVPQAARAAAAKATGLPLEAVTVHNFLMGGGFGRRLESDMVVRAIEVARQVDGPVKVVWSREEDMQHDLYRPYYVDRLEAGLDASGAPIAWRHRIAGSSIMARLYPQAFKGVDADAVESAVDRPYRTPNALVEFVRTESPVVTSWWRGVGPLRSLFVVESFIDELAHAAGADPVDYRLRLLDDPRARAVLELARSRSGWDKPPPRGRARGVSLLHAWGTYMAQVMEVEAGPEGLPAVRRVTVAVDCGQVINPDGVRAQVEGGVIFGLSAALHGQITFAKGRAEQSNFHDYRVLRIYEAPQIETHIVASTADPGGIGEPPTAGSAPALANALFALTGKRVRKLPLAAALT